MQILCGSECSGVNSKRIKREYYERNKKLVIERSTSFAANNPDKIKKYYETSKDKRCEYGKIYRDKNKDKLSKQKIEYGRSYNKRPERIEYMKEYRKPEERRVKERESGRKWSKKNPDIEKNGHLRRTFGIDLETYNKMLSDQNGACSICKNPETSVVKNTGKIKTLAVDHCHTTGKVRGLLCWNCNTSIGKMKDSVEILQNAIEYLKKHKEQ
jgi:hypothetical protein